ncbi:RHS repeat-associated core domain-containing protein [uncultured Marinobacter sp.]|uniref:RHS repeat-associated core domain-containing protein n=1 Tax=uncultured Marinobacter sp. TaxID=187379 RepID=UPI0030D8750E
MNRSIMNTLAALAVLIFTVLPLSAAEVVTYYHNDHLGSPVVGTDSSGAVVWQQAYDPWGLKITTNTDARGYTGNWLDEETGLADHKARWYTSSIGRFTAIDPVKWQESNIHSFNRYAYASNNPYVYTDRDGRNAVTAFGGLIVESISALRGNGFNGARVLGALADGYNGEGAGFARSLYQDAESFVPIGAVAGALIKSAKLAKTAVTKGPGLETRGYKPQPGERTIQGQVDAATQAGNPTVQRGGQDLFRLRSSGHGKTGATATPQNVRNVTPNGRVFTGKGADRAVTPRNIRELHKAQTGQGTSTLRSRSGR